MHRSRAARVAFAGALAGLFFSVSAPSRAEPLITQGIGVQSCGKLANDLKPSEGLFNPWEQ